MKAVADTLGVARSNLIDQLAGDTARRGRYPRQGDNELLAAIRQLTDGRPTDGYRRITALLNRARSAAAPRRLMTSTSSASWHRAGCSRSRMSAGVRCVPTREASSPWPLQPTLVLR